MYNTILGSVSMVTPAGLGVIRIDAIAKRINDGLAASAAALVNPATVTLAFPGASAGTEEAADVATVAEAFRRAGYDVALDFDGQQVSVRRRHHHHRRHRHHHTFVAPGANLTVTERRCG
jgi:hypothetical protein